MSKKLEDGGRQRAREKVGRARSHGAPTGIELQGSVLCTHVREVWVDSGADRAVVQPKDDRRWTWRCWDVF